MEVVNVSLRGGVVRGMVGRSAGAAVGGAAVALPFPALVLQNLHLGPR